jgi:glycosyltransferase involved in cell wall biosynthesis
MQHDDGSGGTREASAPLRQATSAGRRPRIVLYAYDAHPEHGSERGAGWGMIRLLAAWSDIWVITRSTPPGTDGYGRWAELQDGVAHVHWVHVPLPGDAILEADINLHTFGWISRAVPHVDYLRWQLYALRRARALHRRLHFDIAWHLTWANVWIGSTAWLVGPPFVLGPVGGGVDAPWRLVPTLGARGMAMAIARWAVRRVARAVNPLARLSWRHAALILVQNPETRDWLPTSTRARSRIFQNAVLTVPDEYRAARTRPTGRTAVFVGRLVPMKGVHLAIAAIARLPDWRLLVVGDGPDRGRLRAMARRVGVVERVEFRGSVPRSEVLRILHDEADVLLFPSLHDEAGMVVAEAMTLGLPVVCLAVGGPPVMAGGGVSPTNPEETVAALAQATVRAAGTTPPPMPTFDELGETLRSEVVAAGLWAPAPPQDTATITGRATSA